MTEQPVIVTGVPPGLTVREITGCEGRRSSVADWLCACGHHERATGAQDVARLTARAQVGHCPHTGAAT